MWLALVTAFILYHYTTSQSVHSATRREPVITPAPTSLVSNESRRSQLQDVGEARGWAAQTLTTSSTMLVDC